MRIWRVLVMCGMAALLGVAAVAVSPADDVAPAPATWEAALTAAREARRAGKLDEALVALATALAEQEAALGKTDPALAATLREQADALFAARRTAEAATTLERALALLDAQPAAADDLTIHLHTLDRLAFYQTFLPNGAPKQPALYQRMIALVEARKGKEDPALILPLGRLADTYLAGKQNADAEAVITRLLAVAEKYYGTDDPRMLDPLGKLASLCRLQKNAARTGETLARILAIAEKAHGADSPRLISPLTQFAAFHADRREFTKADPLILRARTIGETAWDAKHLNRLLLYNQLALFHRRYRQYAQAEELLTAIIAYHEAQPGVGGSPEQLLLDPLGQLADCYLAEKKLADAEATVTRLREIAARCLSPDSGAWAPILSRQSALLRAQGKTEEAEAVDARIMALTSPKP